MLLAWQAKRAWPISLHMARDLVTRYAAGKIIGGVCHGPIFLANVKAPDGSYVVRVAPASRWLITAFPL